MRVIAFGHDAPRRIRIWSFHNPNSLDFLGDFWSSATVHTFDRTLLKVMKVGLIQNSASVKVDTNIEKSITLIRLAAEKGAQIICLQELFASQYFCQTCESGPFQLAETLESSFVRQFRDLAAELEIVLVLPYFEKRAEGIFHNSAAVIDADGSIAGHYRKMHIPNDPQFYEKFYFTPGDTGYDSFQTRYGKVGVCICWDQWFPEAARLTALTGAQIIFYPTAIGWHPDDLEVEGLAESQLDAWRVVQRGHAVANSCFVAAANRCGTESSPDPNDKPIQFWGHSFIADPSGTLLAEAGDEDEVVIAEVDLDSIAERRRMWGFFRDRRIDSYDGISTHGSEVSS